MSALQPNEWHQIGQHSLRFEEPDVVHMRIIGDLTITEVQQLLHTDDSFPKTDKGYFALIDIPDAGRPNLEILKSEEILEKFKIYRAVVYYRAEFKHRTVIEIVQKVSRTFKLSLSAIPLVAFATEAEARSWIDDHRQQHA